MSQITLIGKGFIGKNLIDLYGHQIGQTFTSRNIVSISDKQHGWIFCAAPSGKKWNANLNPFEDHKNCELLIKHLLQTKFERLFLFSTTDVYDHQITSSQNEDSHLYSLEPYGQNRRMIEASLLESGKKVHVIRLPALFGNHLEKNYIFDLIHSNNLDRIRIHSSFQWFNIRNLTKFIPKIVEDEISVLNIATQPIDTKMIIDLFFPETLSFLERTHKGMNYDMKTKYSNIGYFSTDDEIISEIGDFLKHVRNNN